MLNIISILFASTIRSATPLIFPALGGTFSERSGVINIGLDGMMTVGAFSAVLVSYKTGSPLLGLLGAMIIGGLFGWLLAFLSIHFKANQVVVGTAINILAGSLTTFLLIEIWGKPGQTDSVSYFTPWGPFNMFTYLALILVAISYYVLYKTPFGLRIRAVGEHPRAADTLGVNVYIMRYICVIISGILAGIGGASLSIGSISLFKEGMVAGKGFIALAAMIFGKWHPIGAALACLFFGLADAIQTISMSFGLNVPKEFLFALPYLLTMLAVSGVVGKSIGPAADGIPYEKGEK
ncbi:ABC transporter permease [Lutispora saccharofermentans]|uniref:ABC transporter permease n=1 Tax=Lutispora saccharofermentans TaxID=3024236 RepID=A0ABT1NBC3_9FIRM|nr:ABC transporter permease [Lutispora saccharofermentans]MCQ1528339.1 ABC transporter permease [Lutispora saccharofermentans]